jgi:hypothetical protein
MKNFLSLVIKFLAISFILGEIITRIFIMDKPLYLYNNNGYYDKIPNLSDKYIRGVPPLTRSFDYRINDLGFNNLLDYKDIDIAKFNIAILGDSYIGEINCNINEDLSSILNNRSNEIQCLQFGGSGLHIVDLIENYKKFDLKKFDLVIFCLDIEMLQFYTGKQEYRSSIENFKKIMYKSKFVQYLNSNHKTFQKVKNLRPNFLKKVLNKDNIAETNIFKTKSFFKENKNAHIMLKDSSQYKFFKHKISDKIILIDHNIVPYNFGDDKHWNKNGKLNAANSIFNFLQVNFRNFD